MARSCGRIRPEVSRDQVPPETLEREREIYRAQVTGKPANIIDKIVEGKIDKFFSGVCLLDQAFIKNPDQTIRDLVSLKIAELGEEDRKVYAPIPKLGERQDS